MTILQTTLKKHDQPIKKKNKSKNTILTFLFKLIYLKTGEKIDLLLTPFFTQAKTFRRIYYLYNLTVFTLN